MPPPFACRASVFFVLRKCKVCHKLPLCHIQPPVMRNKSQKNDKFTLCNPFGTNFVLYTVSRALIPGTTEQL